MPYARELSITYGGVTLGGADTNNLLYDTYRLSADSETLEFSARVMCRAATAAAFATACAALEAAFMTVNGTLVVTLGGSTFTSVSHSANTGFLARPYFRKIGGAQDSGRARLYEVGVKAQRPASATNGLRIGSFEVTQDTFLKRSYKISGTFTALSSNGARAQYLARISTLAASWESTLAGSPGTWLATDHQYQADDQDKIVTFSYAAIENGLRDATYEVTTLANGTRRYRISGTYSAVGATGAVATYTAAIGGLLTTIESALTGTWLRIDSQYNRDDNDKLIRFVYSGIEAELLHDGQYRVTTSTEGVRTYVITGMYVKSGATGSKAYYTANIGTLLGSIETALTGTWERGESTYEQDSSDKFTRFAATATELIHNQSSAGTDHAALKGARITVSRTHLAPGDADSSVSRPVELRIAYDTGVDKSVSTNLKGLWNDTIKPYLLSYARGLTNGGPAALTRVTPDFDPTRNRISATIELLVFEGSSILARRVRTVHDREFGRLLWPVWNGDPDAFEEFGGHSKKLLIVSEETLWLGAPGAAAEGAGGDPVGGEGGFGDAEDDDIGPDGVGATTSGYRLLKKVRPREPITIGLPELNTTLTKEEIVY
ncbi:MAG TPA: hypothetical protein VEA38_12095, partial [Terriglobales bacterium]|nr:hypothetical protein [Terriglobales bacterium]